MLKPVCLIPPSLFLSLNEGKSRHRSLLQSLQRPAVRQHVQDAARHALLHERLMRSSHYLAQMNKSLLFVFDCTAFEGSLTFAVCESLVRCADKLR